MSERDQLPSVRALLDRARGHLTAADLPRLVMSDPGSAGYVAAYTEVLARGVPALFEDVEREGRRITSFDITENLLLSHTDAGESIVHRWFSVLTACIELLGAHLSRDVPLSATLSTLLVDSFALVEGGAADAPLDLVPALARELQATREHPHERALAMLAELLSATSSDADVDDCCRALGASHGEFQEWYDERNEKNAFYAARPEFVLGAVVTRRQLRAWLELIEHHFPTSTELARETRDRLLVEGRAWWRTSRK